MLMMVFGLLTVLLLAGLIIAVFIGGVALFRRDEDRAAFDDEGEEASARHILNQRLARGEISAEEYQELSHRMEQE
jgi:uncharacterized membrane protein